jgi:hypothetical protein
VSTTTIAELGHSPTIPTTAILAVTAAVAVQPCSYSTAIAGCCQATTAVSRQQLSMLQLQEDGPLRSRMPPAQEKQLTTSSGTRGQLAEGPLEGFCTTDSLLQLHHRGGDSHRKRRASGYVLPQLMSYYYSI